MLRMDSFVMFDAALLRLVEEPVGFLYGNFCDPLRVIVGGTIF